MGCASSTPMIQTTGSEMLKAATHVASDATKTAEDAVEGIKDSVGKTLETAKDSVATTVESVKHEVEHVVKDKTEMLEDAKNSLMEKLHLKPNEQENKNNNENTSNENNSNSSSTTKDEEHDETKAETDEVKTQLNENLKHSNSSDGIGDSAASDDDNNIEANVDKMTNSLEGSIEDTIKDVKETHTDTEIDSLKTSTPETEIEQSMTKNQDKIKEDDDDDKSNISDLENLAAEHLDEATAKLVNDISKINNNDPLITAMIHENIKNLDNNNFKSLKTEQKAIKDNELETAATTTTITTTNSHSDNDNKTNIMHKTAQIPTAVPAKTHESHKHSHQKQPQQQHHPHSPPPLFPLTLATTAIVSATAQPRILKETEHEKQNATKAITKPSSTDSKHSSHTLPPQHTKEKMEKSKKPKVHKKMEKVNPETEEKRPRTTEWEKFADMLAQVRKYNPQDTFRRGGTFSKFSTVGIGQFRERPSYLGYHVRGGMDDDSSDTTSNFRGSPYNSQRSSARAGGRVQCLPNRPNTGNIRKNNHEFSSNFGGGGGGVVGGRYATKMRRNSNISSAAGRKFDYNPLRSRVHEFVSSTPFLNNNSLQKTNTLNSQMPYAPYNNNNHNKSFANESVKSPGNMRSHHSRSETRILPPLENHLDYSQLESQQQQQQQHYKYDYNDHVDHNPNTSNNNNNSDLYNPEMPLLIRESSNTSLFSNNSYVENHKSSHQDVRLLTTNHPPVKNTSSFLATPRSSPFSIRKSYTDLYFSATGNKENKPQAGTEFSSRDKSPYKIRKRCDVCCKKYALK
ncbi:uncharacterized protein ACRADG_002521 [Cochliomyia hominivorax]